MTSFFDQPAPAEIARAEDQGHDEEDADAGVERQADRPPHQRLAKGAANRQDISDKVEFCSLG